MKNEIKKLAIRWLISAPVAYYLFVSKNNILFKITANMNTAETLEFYQKSNSFLGFLVFFFFMVIVIEKLQNLIDQKIKK